MCVVSWPTVVAALASASVDFNVQKSQGKAAAVSQRTSIRFLPADQEEPALLHRYAPGGLIPGHTDYVPRVTLAKAEGQAHPVSA